MIPETILEDPLSYLPRTAIQEYKRGQVIYDRDSPNARLHLVIKGYVKVVRFSGKSEIVINLCQVDDFFGEPALVPAQGEEEAVTVEPSDIMSWPVQMIPDLISRNPALGFALLQRLAGRCVDLGERITELSSDSTCARLGKTLLHLADRIGDEGPCYTDIRTLAPISHKLLSQYIGTTREAVTHCMNDFRRQGLVSYSRRNVTIRCEALREALGLPRTPKP